MAKVHGLLQGKSKEEVKALKKNMKLFIKIFNNLCAVCKSKVWFNERRNKRTAYAEYCESCQRMVDDFNEGRR